MYTLIEEILMFNFLKKKCVVYMYFVLILFFLSLPVFAAPPTFDWLKITLNTANGVYIDANDTVVFTLKALNKTSKTATLAYTLKRNLKNELKSGEITLVNGSATLSRKMVEPGTLFLEVKLADKKTSIGVTYNPFAIQPSMKAPDDFDAFWNREKKALAKIPMNAKIIPVAVPKKIKYGVPVECFDVTLDCTGDKKVHGYYVRPINAKAKSVPAYIGLHSAGIRDSSLHGAWNTAIKNAIAININAHGLENGQTREYYNAIRDNELRGYQYKGIESPETYYFKGMYLRIVRAIDFLTSQPEWNGKVLIATGGSQGGGQSLVAAGLDARITEIKVVVPAFCDLMTVKGIRQNGWPGRLAKNENQKKTVSYFDACYFSARFKGKSTFEVGLIDRVCPATGIFAAYNQLSGEKKIIILPQRGHPGRRLARKNASNPLYTHIGSASAAGLK